MTLSQSRSKLLILLCNSKNIDALSTFAGHTLLCYFWSSLIWTFLNFDIVQNGRSVAIFTTHKAYICTTTQKLEKLALLWKYIIRLLFWSSLMWTVWNFNIVQNGRLAAILLLIKHILHYYLKTIEDGTFSWNTLSGYFLV